MFKSNENSKRIIKRNQDHLGVIQQIEQAEIELNHQVTEARQAAEDCLLQAQRDASVRIQREQESARQARREMVRTEMEAAEHNAIQELKNAEISAQNYFTKGTEFVSQAVSDALKMIIGKEDSG